MMKFLLLIILGLSSALQLNASGLRCENLFLTKTDFQQAASKLAAFRAEMIAEVNDAEKLKLSKDFDHKFEELIRSVGDFNQAKDFLVEAMRQQAEAHKNLRRSTQDKRREKTGKLHQEEDHVQRWQRFKKFTGYHDNVFFKHFLTPDGLKLISVNYEKIKILDLKTLDSVERAIPVTYGDIRSAALSVDGKKLFITGLWADQLDIFDLATMRRIKNPIKIEEPRSGTQIVVNPNGSCLILLDGSTSFQMLQLKGMKKISLPASWSQFGVMSHGQFTHDGLKFIASDASGRVIMFDTQLKDEPKILAEASQMLQVQISPDGLKLLITSAQKIEVVDLKTGDKKTFVDLPSDRFLQFLSFSPDGSRLVIKFFSKTEKDIQIWDFNTIQRLSKIDFENTFVKAITSNDNTLLVAGGAQGAFKLFDAATGDEMSLPIDLQNKNKTYVYMTKDDSKLIVFCEDGEMYVFFRNPDEARQLDEAVP